MTKKIINTRLLTHWIPLLMLLCLSCGRKVGVNNEMPANILNEEQFTQVLMDYSLAESAFNINVKNVASQKIDSIYAFNPLRENGVRKSQYDSSVFFYCQNSALYKKIYENVLAKITELQTIRNNAKVPASK